MKRPLVLGINGVDTSGKTNFAKGLKSYLDFNGYHTQLIHIDDFHNPREIRRKDTSPQGYVNYAFDLTRIAVLLKKLKENPSEETIMALDLDEDTYTKELSFTSTAETIIIVEGTMLFRPPVDELIDHKVYLDIDFNEVIKRAKVRDVPKYGIEFLNNYRNRYIPAQELYINEFQPKSICDVLIYNHDYNKPVIK